MVDSIGKILCQARLKRGLTLDEAAHATKLRPDKILALENDDYSNFASNAYARGFLQIYGRFLKVDVSDYTASFDTSARISVDDYQYLSSAHGVRTEPKRDLPDLSRRKQPSIVPLFVCFGLIIIGFFIFTAYVNWQRITGELTQHKDLLRAAEVANAASESDRKKSHTTAAPEIAAATPAPEPPVVAPPEPPTAPVVTKAAMSDRDFLAADAPPVVPAASPASPDSDTVTPQPVQVNEIEISAARRTWITVRRDDPNSLPIFEGDIYPKVRPLRLKGTRFLIESRDAEAVQIRKNGSPIAYQVPGITVQ